MSNSSLHHRRMTTTTTTTATLVVLYFSWFLVVAATTANDATTGTPPTVTSSSTSTSTLPRSHAGKSRGILQQEQPPWNPSPRIDQDGFLTDLYYTAPGEWEVDIPCRTCYPTGLYCRIRQVPGDGNCLFHSIALAHQYALEGHHPDYVHDETTLAALYRQAAQLRSQAVQCLQPSPPTASATTATTTTTAQLSSSSSSSSSSLHQQQQQPQKHRGHRSRMLFLQGRESLSAQELVSAAAQQYGLTPEQYCTAMRQDSVWGGGPEIVALCNVLQRPIHVYELASAAMVDDTDHHDDHDEDRENNNDSNEQHDNHQPDMVIDADDVHCEPYYHHTRSSNNNKLCFVLRRMACFGSPRFDRRPALHILSADSRFPDLQPGQQMAAGNHFLAVFPVTDDDDDHDDDDHDGSFRACQQRQLRRRKKIRGGSFTSRNGTRSRSSFQSRQQLLHKGKVVEEKSSSVRSQRRHEQHPTAAWWQWWKHLWNRFYL